MNIEDKLAYALRAVLCADKCSEFERESVKADARICADAALAEYDAARALHRDPAKNYPATNTGD